MRLGLEPLQAELAALEKACVAIDEFSKPSEEIRERIQELFRSWLSSTKPHLQSLVTSHRDLRKLERELEELSKLSSSKEHTGLFLRRVKIAVKLADELVLGFPAGAGRSRALYGDSLFLDEISDVPVWLVPNAILGWRSQMKIQLRSYPFDTSVFVMIRYRNRTRSLIKAIKEELTEGGLNTIIASEHNITNDLYNPIACLLCCSKGIAIFDQEESTERYNPNVAYELGMLHLLSRECLILKHSSLPRLQTDILMKLYQQYSSAADLRREVRTWVAAHSPKAAIAGPL